MAVGIVRRIDELGRIVIPKEMRKTMRLQVGDEMEISANDEGLTLKRYSGFQSVLPSCKAIIKALAEAKDCDAVAVNANEVVVAEGKNKKQFQGAKISDALSNRIRKRKEEMLDKSSLSNAFDNVDCPRDCAIVQPVVAGGDLVGAIMLMKDESPKDSDKDYLRFCADLISASLTE